MTELAVNFDLESDLFMALESFSEALLKVRVGNQCYLKWVLIFGHTALQNAMCLSLVTSASFLERKKTSYNHEYGELDNIEWLYLKLRNSELLPYIDSKVIPQDQDELKQIKKLQAIRNTFIHQQSAQYVYTFNELIEAVKLTVKLISFLVSSSERMALKTVASKTLLEDKLCLLKAQISEFQELECRNRDRYRYRTDLTTHFEEIFPQYQKQSYLLMLISLFEDYLNQLCSSLHFENEFCCSLKEYSGSGIERAKKYLVKVAKIKVPTETESWKKIIDARNIRNIIAHNAGHLDKDGHKKQLQIVADSKHLDSEYYARIHLKINQRYLFEVIQSMQEVAELLWSTTR